MFVASFGVRASQGEKLRYLLTLGAGAVARPPSRHDRRGGYLLFIIYYLLFMYGTYGIQAVTVEREKPSESASGP